MPKTKLVSDIPTGKTKKLPREFYERSTLQVAKDILGKHLVYHHPEGKLSAKIVEVEAYIGKGDPACHAARGKTPRNSVMFGPGGHAYIYFIYGMYHCLNFVTEAEPEPAAVLIRAAEPDEGLNIMLLNSPVKNSQSLLSGPGKLCRAFGLTRDQSGLDLTQNTLYLERRENAGIEIGKTTRIGIKDGADKLWRFYDKESSAVSALRKFRN